MSVDAISWAFKQHADATAKLILICLADYADADGTCWPTQCRIAERCCVSIDTVRRHLIALEKAGLLQREKRYREDGTQTSDRFVIPLQDKGVPLQDKGETPAYVPPLYEPSLKKKKEDTSSLRSDVAHPSALDELCAVLDKEHAIDVIDHRKNLRKPLTASAAKKLAAKFAKCPNPNEAADAMLSNGWQGFEPAWLEGRATGPPNRRSGRQSLREAGAALIARIREKQGGNDGQSQGDSKDDLFGSGAGVADGVPDAAAPALGSWTEDGVRHLLPGKRIEDDERRWMEGRLSILRRHLNARDPESVLQAIIKLLAGYPSVADRSIDPQMTLAAYAGALESQPSWAAIKACTGWLEGRFEKASAFAPSAAELRDAAASIARPFKVEMAEVEDILSARLSEESPAVRERVMKGFEELRDELRERMNPVPYGPPKPNARQRYEQICAEAGVDPDSVPDQPDAMQRLRAAEPKPCTRAYEAWQNAMSAKSP